MAVAEVSREEARNHFTSLFQSVGQAPRDQGGQLGGLLSGGAGEQLMEFVQMPLDLAQIFGEMAFGLTELVLESLAEAGWTLVKGLTPA